MWAPVRLGVWVVVTGLVSILVATALHLDKFHLHSPVWTARMWAWSWLFLYVALVPGLLTARMVGSFYLAIGVSLFVAARENDYARIRVASAAYVVFAVLQGVTAPRYPVVNWLAAPGLLLAALLLALFAIGSVGMHGGWFS